MTTDSLQLPDSEPPQRQLQVAHQGGQLQRYPPGSPYGPQTVDEDVIDLREYWQTLMRRKWTVMLVMLVAVVLALVATFVSTPIYKGEVLLQIDRAGNQVVEYGNVAPDEQANLTDKEFYATQYELLQSRTLARRVIDQVGLQAREDDKETPSFLDQARAAVKGVIGAFTSDDDTQSANGVDPEAVQRRAEEELFAESLTVEPVKNSRLVRVEFDSPSATEAAAVANAIANNFIAVNLERRYEAASYAKEFLEQQLVQMRATLEESERRFAAYARDREIVNVENRLEIMLNKLREMNNTLVEAEADRFEAEADYQEMLEASRGGAPDILASEVIQTLKERRIALKAEYEENLKVFKPGYPKMQRLQSQIDELTEEIARETAAIAEGVKARYEARVREEVQLRQRIQEVKNEALALQDRSTDYETLKRELETNRELYDGLLQRMKEVGVAAGVGENNISIVDAAHVPLEPYKPSLKKNVAIAVALGLFLGVGLAFLLEALDDSLKGREAVERIVGSPVLSLVPYAAPQEYGLGQTELPLLAFKDPTSAVAEATRSLRTALLFSTETGAPRILHFTSASPGEGKTTTAVSTAITFAQAGGKVLIIDADLRNPSLHRAFSLPNSTGLTNHLAGGAEVADVAQPTQVKGLFTITSGPLPPNPVELLSTSKMADLLSLAMERFDQVIVDGPPVIGLADALVLANLSKATILVVEAGGTRTRELEDAVRRLSQANAHLIGAVMTKVGRRGQSYGYGYGYRYQYQYLYSYGGKGDHPKLPEQESA